MSERKLRTNSETNRQLMNSMKRTKRIYPFFAVIIATAFISSAITLTISADTPASAPDTVIDWEGLEAYKINGIRYASASTNDAIADAIDDLPVEGGLVVVPEGDGTWDSEYTISQSNVAIVSYANTVLRMSSTNANGIFVITGSNVTVAGFHLIGFTPAPALFATGCHVSGAENVRVMGLTVSNWMGYPFGATSANHVSFEDCYVVSGQSDPGTTGGVFASESTNVSFEGCAIEGGVTLTGNDTKYCLVTNCKLQGLTDSHGGVYVFNGANNCTIIGNTITGFPHAGIELRGGNCSVRDNTIFQNSDGIQVFDFSAEENNVRDNIISGNHVSESTNDGIKIFSTAGVNPPARIVLSGNFIQENGAYGIDAPHSTVNRLTIVDNELRSNGNIEIYCLSPYSIVSENVIKNTVSHAIRIGSNCSVTGNMIYNSTASGKVGIYLGVYVVDTVISANHIEGFFDGYGILLYQENRRCTLVGNIICNINSATGGGIGISISIGSKITVSGNVISGVNGYGLYVYGGSTGISITDNVISDNLRRGIYIKDSDYCVISSNSVCDNSRASANSYSGIVLVNTENSTITENVAINTGSYGSTTPTQRYGIESTGTSNNLRLIANICTPNLAGNYSLVGTNILYWNT